MFVQFPYLFERSQSLRFESNRVTSRNRPHETINHLRLVAVPKGVRVVIHSSQPFESVTSNPLGKDQAPHTIWTWPDGSWLLVRFLDDGGNRAVTSPGISAALVERGEMLVVRVDPVVLVSDEAKERRSQLL